MARWTVCRVTSVRSIRTFGKLYFCNKVYDVVCDHFIDKGKGLKSNFTLNCRVVENASAILKQWSNLSRVTLFYVRVLLKPGILVANVIPENIEFWIENLSTWARLPIKCSIVTFWIVLEITFSWSDRICKAQTILQDG